MKYGTRLPDSLTDWKRLFSCSFYLSCLLHCRCDVLLILMVLKLADYLSLAGGCASS